MLINEKRRDRLGCLRQKKRNIYQSDNQGRSQPHSPGWARVPLSSFFLEIWIKFSYFSSNCSHFLPHFDPPGGQVAQKSRPPGKTLATPLVTITNNTGQKKNDAIVVKYATNCGRTP